MIGVVSRCLAHARPPPGWLTGCCRGPLCLSPRMFSRRLAVSRAVRILEARAWTAGSRSVSLCWTNSGISTSRACVIAYVSLDESVPCTGRSVSSRRPSRWTDSWEDEKPARGSWTSGAVRVMMPVIWERRLDRDSRVLAQCRDVSAEVTSIEYYNSPDPSTMLWCSTRGKRKAASPIDWFRTSTRNWARRPRCRGLPSRRVAGRLRECVLRI